MRHSACLDPYKSKTSFTGDGHSKPILKEVKDQLLLGQTGPVGYPPNQQNGVSSIGRVPGKARGETPRGPADADRPGLLPTGIRVGLRYHAGDRGRAEPANVDVGLINGPPP